MKEVIGIFTIEYNEDTKHMTVVKGEKEIVFDVQTAEQTDTNKMFEMLCEIGRKLTSDVESIET